MLTKSISVATLFALLTFSAASAEEIGKPADPNNLRRTITVGVVEKTKNSVVYISSRKLVAEQFSQFGDDPFFRNFGPQQTRLVPKDSLGSGFVIHEDGYVITNNHVIDRARQITVEFVNGQKFEAELVGSDPEADLAVLKVKTDQKLPAIELGDSSDLMIGEPVIAVGNPLGYSHSVSTGIVSAIHRDLKDNEGNPILVDLVQTDAAINPGNSGGPLLNAYGQVIGINTAIRNDAQNIGFAIQVNRLRDLLPELMKPSVINKIDIAARFAERRAITAPANVRSEVLLVGDSPRVVQAINGNEVKSVVDAQVELLKVRRGESVKIKFADGTDATLPTGDVPLPDVVVQARDRIGIVIEEVTPALAQKYGLSVEQGLLITEVRRGSAAARTGLRPGDVMLQLGPRWVGSLSDLGILLKAIPDKSRVRVAIVRGNEMSVGVLQF